MNNPIPNPNPMWDVASLLLSTELHTIRNMSTTQKNEMYMHILSDSILTDKPLRDRLPSKPRLV